MSLFEYTVFGNLGGSHQLLESSLVGQDPVLGELRFLVDRPVGYVGSEVVWSPYWGCGPLLDWWILWRGEEDSSAPRKNMVKTRVAMIRHRDLCSVEKLEEHIAFLATTSPVDEGLSVRAIDALSRGIRPVVVAGLSTAPALLLTLWPRLWPAARRRLALRTLFGSETLESGAAPDIVVIPSELRPRWRSHTVLDIGAEQPLTDPTAWFSGADAPELEQLLRVNWENLPDEFTVLTRLKRIARAAKALQEGRGAFAEALLIVRTVEAFDGGLELPSNIIALVRAHVSETETAKISDIRAASLATLTLIGDSVQVVEEATSKWVQENLPDESDGDAMWVLEHQARSDHVPWWLRAVRKGLTNAFAKLTSTWAEAMWRWWTANPEAVGWTQSLLPVDSETEASLHSYLPNEISVELQRRIRTLCTERQWANLLAGILGRNESLADAVSLLRESVSNPESGLDSLMESYGAGEIVGAAALNGWPPLVQRTVRWTARDPALFEGVDIDSAGFWPLLAMHLSSGRDLPSIVNEAEFEFRLFDGCLDNNACLDIVKHLGARAAEAALRYSRQEELFEALGIASREPLLSTTARLWLNAFVMGEKLAKPGPVLSSSIRQLARQALRGGSIAGVLDYLIMFHEVSEMEAVDWLDAEGFSWQRGDHERFAELLRAREWTVAARRFRWSWKNELQVVAWHARGLLRPWEQFWIAPRTAATGLFGTTEYVYEGQDSQRLKILFLAANPSSSGRLAIDEEARSIEEKVRLARLRDSVEFRTKWAQRPGDLQQALLEEEPTVVHFSGHGGGDIGIVLHSDTSEEESLVSSSALADLLKVLKDNIRVVVLNACYSEEQAQAIVEEIDFVVGMVDSIGDEAARVFAAAFYRGLAFGRSVQTAFDLGVNELKLRALKDDEDVPLLLTRDGVDSASVMLVSAAPP